MTEDTKRLNLEAEEFSKRVMNDKEPTAMPANYCVECGNFECECKIINEDDLRREEARREEANRQEANRELSNQLLHNKEE